MTKVILPAFAMIIAIGGMVDPDAPISGKVAIHAILVGVASYIGCRLGDWLFSVRVIHR